jgi:hypothetical protein
VGKGEGLRVVGKGEGLRVVGKGGKGKGWERKEERVKGGKGGRGGKGAKRGKGLGGRAPFPTTLKPSPFPTPNLSSFSHYA